MTEKDIDTMKGIMEDTMKLHLERIHGELGLIKLDVNYIKAQTTKTNGTVIRHDGEIRTLMMTESTHVLNCPHNEPVADFIAIRKYWKPLAIAALVVGFISVSGALATVSMLNDLYKKNAVVVQKVEKEAKKSSEDNKEIKDDVLQNTKAINDLGTDKAFKESLKEK